MRRKSAAAEARRPRVTLLGGADLGELAERIVIVREQLQRLMQRPLGLGGTFPDQLEMADLGQHPGAIFGLVIRVRPKAAASARAPPRCRRRARADRRRASTPECCRDAGRASTGRPLLRVVVPAQLDVRVGQHAVDHEVVGHGLLRLVARARASAKRCWPSSTQVRTFAPRSCRAPASSDVLPRRPRPAGRTGIGGFAGALGQGQRQLVVAADRLRVAPDRLPRDRDLALGWRFGVSRRWPRADARLGRRARSRLPTSTRRSIGVRGTRSSWERSPWAAAPAATGPQVTGSEKRRGGSQAGILSR